MLEQVAGRWSIVLGPVDVVLGRSGIAPTAEAKLEGDGRTPRGTYPLLYAFGYEPGFPTALTWRQATEDDLWVDDPTHPDYNRWVKSPTTAQSVEKLRRHDALYELAIVVGYNTDPIVAGKGSAIFVHVWRGPDSPTAGCVAMAREDLAALLRRLDPAKGPVIRMDP